MKEKTDIKPVFKYVRIDEIKYWNKEFVSNLGHGAKIIATYVYDETERTFCCEITPSHWLEYMGTHAEPGRELTEDEWEKVYDFIMEGEAASGETGHYQYCVTVKNLNPQDVPCDCEDLEEVRELWNGNPW